MLAPKIALLAIAALTLGAEESVRQMFERARLLEERNRNLVEAIKIFERVVARSRDDRALAARAQLEQGLLYARLGQTEQAREAFRKVITDFPDQPPLVREARARLGVSGSVKAGLSVRQVWATPDTDNTGSPSPDGRYLSFTEWPAGAVSIRDLATGEKRRLTNQSAAQTQDAKPWSSVFSPDSKRVAYWSTDWGSVSEIRTVGLDGSAPRTLCRVTDAGLVELMDWSRDGAHILAYIESKTPAQIAIINAADGSIRPVKPALRWPGRMSFSPDGKYVLYDGPDGDVHLLSTDGRRDVALAPHPAADFAAGWSPDGQRILFISDRTGPLSLWTLAVKDGEAQGEPQMVLADAGNIQPLGITRNGSFYYWLTTGLVDVYTAAIDPETAAVLEPPKPVPHRFVASNMSPDWSLDGKYLLYQSNRPGSDSLIVIRSVETGGERELRTGGLAGVPRWNAAGDAILAAGKRGISSIDPRSGEAALSVELPAGNITISPSWSRDGKTLFGRFDGYRGIHRLDVSARRVQQLYTVRRDDKVYEETGPGDPLLSPDGRSVLFQVRDRSQGIDSLLAMPPEGGEPRTVISVKSPAQFPAGAYAWTPDSRRIVFVQRIGKQFEVLVIPAEGGEPRRTGIHLNGIRNLRLHPDGRRIAFQVGEIDGEVWVAQNLF